MRGAASGLVGALALGGCVVGYAGPGDPGQDAETLLERALQDHQLKAAGRRSQGAEEAPADVTVLGSEEIRALGYRTVGQALAGVLGFRDNDDRAYANVGVRGLYVLGDQNTRVLVLLDGHPLNSPSEVGSSKVGEDLGIPMERLDRIEIIRGPASSLYGSNAFLAVVNVVTLEARAEGPGEGRLGVSAGSGGLVDLWGSAALPLGGVRLRLEAGGFRRAGFAQRFPELSAELFPAGLDREERQHAYGVASGAGWSLATYWMSRLQRLPHAPFQSRVGDEGNFYRNRVAFGELRLEPRWGEVQGLARVAWDWNLFSDQLDYDGQRETGQLGRWVDRDLNQGLGGELQVRTPLGEAWHLILGFEQGWHRFRYTLFSPGSENPRQIDYRIRKAYGESEWSPSASFILTLGLQYSELLLDRGRALRNPSRTFVLGRYGGLSAGAAGVPKFDFIIQQWPSCHPKRHISGRTCSIKIDGVGGIDAARIQHSSRNAPRTAANNLSSMLCRQPILFW